MLSRILKGRAIIAWVLACVVTAPLVASEMVRGHLVDVSFVEDKLGETDWVIFDARNPADYKKGHIPGAVNLGIVTGKEKVAWDIYRDPTARWLPADKLEELFGMVGINYDKRVIVYGKKGDYHSGLVVMVLNYLDHNNAYFLDGGWEKWTSNGGKVETTVNKPDGVTFKTRKVHDDMYVTTEEMYHYVQNPGSVTIMDVRSVEEWEGTKMLSVRGGRIPGAVHLPVYDLINKDGTLVATSKMEEIYKDVPKDKPVVAYCQRGCRVSFPYMALKLLGHDVQYYDGSWRVWGMQENLPAENEQWIHIKKIFVLEKKMKSALEEIQDLKLQLEQLKTGEVATAVPEDKQ